MTVLVIFFWLYFLAYILMGFYQPVDAICRLISSRKIDNAYTAGLKRYLLAVLAYFLILIGMYVIDPHVNIEGLAIFYLFFLPWGYSIWYINHIRTWNEKMERQSKT